MSDNIECPFCGEIFPPFASCSLAEHPEVPSSECPVQGQRFTNKRWNMRPPKKEVGHTPAQGEVEWLRALVKELIAKPPVIQITEPSVGKE